MELVPGAIATGSDYVASGYPVAIAPGTDDLIITLAH